MAVLTEITNSDKDLLLNGDCTIKTKLLISDTKLPGPSYEMQYDTENDYYYLNGESYQETRSGDNLLNYRTVTGSTSTTVLLIDNGFNVNGRFAGIVTVNNLKENTDYYLQYITENIVGTTKYVLVFPHGDTSGNLKSFGSGTGGTFNTGSNTSIDIWFYASTGTTGSVNFTDIMLSEGTNSKTYEDYGIMPSPEYPSPISSIKGQIQMVVPYPTDKKLLTVDLGENELCSLPNNVFDKLVYDTKRNIFNSNTVLTGYLIDDRNGNANANNSSIASDFIEIKPNTNYYITKIPSGNWGAWYDENKNYISGILGYQSQLSPANAKYMRLTVSYNQNNLEYAQSFMVHVGETEIPYKPYRASDVYVDKKIGKWSVSISSISTLSNGNIGSAVAPIPTKKKTGTSTILAEKAKYIQSYEPGTCYENPANVVFVGTSTDTLTTMQEKYNGGFLQYRLETPSEISLSNYSTQDITILTETNSVKDWTIDDERYVPDVGFFGQFTAKELTGNLQNITDDFNIEDKYVEVRMGLSKFKSTTTNWYSLGTYIISKPNDDEVSDNTKYTGYDLTILFNIPFDANFTNNAFTKSFNDMLKEQSYVTNGWLANYTCAQVGIKLGSTNFIHSDFKILSNQFTSGETCRDIMKYISELAFGYCEVDWDDICYIRTLNKEYANFDKYHKLNYDQYYSLETQKKSYGPVNRVFCGLQDVDGQGHELTDGNSTSTDTTTINIYNNPLTMGTTLEISDQLQLEAIQGCDILWGIQYRPITKMETIGHPWLKAYEPIEVSDMELNKIITYPFTNTLKYTGHIKSDISSEGETKTEDTYGYKDSVERRMNRIGINVDRANKEITIINQEITKIGDDIKDIRGNMITIGDVYTKSEIRDIVSGVGVDGIVVTSLETATTIFDINGMTIGRTDAQTKTNVNANGMIISNANDNTELLKINNQGVYSENLTARTYLNFGTHGRFEKYNESGHDRIGCFWIEGDE